MAKKLTALELSAQGTPQGFVTTLLFAGWNGIIRGSVADGTSPEIVGRRGRIWLFDEERIAVFFQHAHFSHEADRVLREVAGASVFCRGDGEGTLLLPNAAIREGAALAQARKRRQVSEEQREVARERAKTSGFGRSRPSSVSVKYTDETGHEKTKNATDAQCAPPEPLGLFSEGFRR